jgi:hypothetical protein
MKHTTTGIGKKSSDQTDNMFGATSQRNGGQDDEDYQSHERASLMPDEENLDDEEAPTDDLGGINGETPDADRKLKLERYISSRKKWNRNWKGPEAICFLEGAESYREDQPNSQNHEENQH